MDPDETLPPTADDTLPPELASTLPPPTLPDPENEGGFQIGYDVRPVTFLPEPLPDFTEFASEALDED